MRIHRWLDFKVTKRCNNYLQKCAYCEVQLDSESATDALSLADVHRTLVDAFALGFDQFWILGGEPTLRADIDRVFEPLADETDVSLTLVTNGKRCRDDAYLALFRTKARRACVQVSLDTLKPINLKRADPAAILTLIAHIGHMARHASGPSHDCCVEVHCVISRDNLQNFDEFARFMAGKGVGTSLAMVCPWKVVDAPSRFNEFTRTECLDIADRIDRLRTCTGVDRFNPVVAANIRRMLNVQENTPRRACGAGLTHLVVNGDGSVFKCMADSFVPSKAIGNIRTGRLHEVLRHVNSPATCVESTACFDGFAWDLLALDDEWRAPACAD